MEQETTKKKRFNYKAPFGWLTTDETMEKFACSRSTLYSIIKEGGFTSEETIRFRGKRLFKKEAVENYFDKYVRNCLAR